MKLIKLISLLAFFSPLASAVDSYYVECDNCSDELQFSQSAKDNAINRKTIFVNVMNFTNYEIRKFSVYKNSKTVCNPNGREPDGEGGFIQDCWLEKTLTATPVSITNDELNVFTELASSVNAMHSSLSRTVEIPKEVLETGYELIGSGYLGNKLIQYYDSLPLTDPTVFSKYMNLAGALSKMVSAAGIEFRAPQLKFTFSDGTEAYAIIDFVDTDGKVHFKFKKLIGHNGLEIDLDSDKPLKNVYKFDFSGMPLASWQKLHSSLKLYGLAFVGANNQNVPQGVVTIVDCSNSTETVCRNPL